MFPSNAVQTVQSDGIYHGLPTFPPNIKGLTAIITGANGISGYFLLQVLLKAPERWTKIYTLSRRPPVVLEKLPEYVEHVPLDFLKSPEEIAKTLKDRRINADYVFFFSYAQPPVKPDGHSYWPSGEELTPVNVALMKNFLGALTLAKIKPRRFLLQTGGKNYGSHLGPTKMPAEEWDPRIELEPNFYYPQEDLLWDFCRENNVGWNVTMPPAILGAVPDAAMNLCLTFAIYATVCKYLNESLDFPGDRVTWQIGISHGSAMLNGYFSEWAVLTDGAKNQKLNICDSSAFTYETFWPRMAGWFGIPWNGPAIEGLKEEEWGYDPPPRGYGPRGKIAYKFSMVAWASRPEVQKAWIEIAAKHDLVTEINDVRKLFGLADWMLHLGDAFLMSMDKSRKLGWHGFVDSIESILEIFHGFEKLKMIPKVPLVEVKFI